MYPVVDLLEQWGDFYRGHSILLGDWKLAADHVGVEDFLAITRGLPSIKERQRLADDLLRGLSTFLAVTIGATEGCVLPRYTFKVCTKRRVWSLRQQHL